MSPVPNNASTPILVQPTLQNLPLPGLTGQAYVPHPAPEGDSVRSVRRLLSSGGPRGRLSPANGDAPKRRANDDNGAATTLAALIG